MDQKDSSGEEADFVKNVAQESTPEAMTAKEVERESENDPEGYLIPTEVSSEVSRVQAMYRVWFKL